MLGIEVYYRCHTCAPSREWRGEGAEETALGHMIGTHGMDLDAASTYLFAYCVDETMPGYNRVPGEGEL